MDPKAIMVRVNNAVHSTDLRNLASIASKLAASATDPTVAAQYRAQALRARSKVGR